MKIPFDKIPLSTRDGALLKDSHSINMMGGKTRPGLLLQSQLPAGPCQAAFESPLGPAVVIGNALYVISSLGVLPAVTIPNAISGEIFSTVTLSAQVSATPKTVLQGYNNLWVVTYIGGVAVVTQVTRGILTTAQSPNYAATVTAAGSGGTDGVYMLDISAPIGLGAGAVGNYTVLSGSLHSIAITAGGDGYTSASAVNLKFTTISLGGVITGGTIVSGGTNATVNGTFPLTITDSSGAGSGAIGTYTLSGYVWGGSHGAHVYASVSAIAITNLGSGYINPASVSFAFPYGGVTGVNVTPIITVAGSIISTTIEAGGSGGVAGTYPLTISDSSGSGSGATGTYVVGSSGAITSATITAGGSGYLNPATVSIYTTVTGASLTVFTSLGGAAGAVTVNALPATMLPGLSLLDTTYYVMDTTGQIHGSALSDPTIWEALNYVALAGNEGDPVAICRHSEYIIAFANNYLMPYYDAGNLPPGSPLGPVLSAYADIGLASVGSLTTTGGLGGALLFVGKSKSAGMSVYMMTGLAAQPVSNTEIDRILDRYLTPDIPSTGTSNTKALALKVDGKDLYVLTLYSSGVAIITLVLDLQSKAWYVWTSSTVSTPDPVIPNAYAQSGFLFNTQIDTDTGQDWLVHDSSGAVCLLSPVVYQDAGLPIDVRVVTPQIEGETSDYMLIGAAEVLGDKVASTGYLRFTRDDYNTWSGYQAVNLQSNRSRVTRQGAARRRAYEFRHTGNAPLNLRSLDLV